MIYIHINIFLLPGITNKKAYVCDHCDRNFAVKRNLALHLKVHDDYETYKYKCIACGVKYCEERLLKYHIRKTHYNLKEDCPGTRKAVNETWVERVQESQTFVQMTKLNNNVVSIKKIATIIKDDVDTTISVTDEKEKFKEYITSVFAQKDKSQYSKAICDYCQKEMLKKSLLSHIRERHLKLRKFHCIECKKSFNRHYQLVGHICGQVRRRWRKNMKNKCDTN